GAQSSAAFELYGAQPNVFCSASPLNWRGMMLISLLDTENSGITLYDVKSLERGGYERGSVVHALALKNTGSNLVHSPDVRPASLDPATWLRLPEKPSMCVNGHRR